MITEALSCFATWESSLDGEPRLPGLRDGGSVPTISGREWWPHDPHPSDVREADFAACALVMRWGGHMRYAPNHPRAGKLAPYSVGQHLCLVYELVTRLGGTTLERAYALYHKLHTIVPPGDPCEAVWRGAEGAEVIRTMSRMAESCFRRALGLTRGLPELVRHADRVVLSTELRDLVRNEHRQSDSDLEPDPLERRIEACDADHTEEAFWRRHRVIQKELCEFRELAGDEHPLIVCSSL